MSYTLFFLLIGLFIVIAVAGSSRFVHLVSVQDQLARRREEDGHLAHRIERLIAQGRMAEAESLHHQVMRSQRTTRPAPPRPASHPRLAHAALLLLVVFWPVSSSQAPVRTPAHAVEAGREAPAGKRLPCIYVKVTPAPTRRVC